MQISPVTASVTAQQPGGFVFHSSDKPTAAESAFMDYQKMTPAQKMRAAILGSMGLTEESLAAMDAPHRQTIEEKIREIIREQLQQAAEKKQTGAAVDVKA